MKAHEVPLQTLSTKELCNCCLQIINGQPCLVIVGPVEPGDCLFAYGCGITQQPFLQLPGFSGRREDLQDTGFAVSHKNKEMVANLRKKHAMFMKQYGDMRKAEQAFVQETQAATRTQGGRVLE